MVTETKLATMVKPITVHYLTTTNGLTYGERDFWTTDAAAEWVADIGNRNKTFQMLKMVDRRGQ